MGNSACFCKARSPEFKSLGPTFKKKIMHACSPSIRGLETDGSQDLEGQPLEQKLPVQGETLCQKLRWRGIIEDS